MGTLNSIAFSLLGLLMGFLPALLPSYFSVTASDGSNHSELWLEFMGSVQVAGGAFCFIRNEIVPLVLRAAAWKMPKATSAKQPEPGVILRPIAVQYLGGPDVPDRSIAA